LIGTAEASAFADCIAGGGVAVFPADTVYGLACGARDARATRRLYALKGRPADKPAAVMFFALAPALAALPELGARTRTVLERLLPAPVTVLLENPERRYGPACGPDPETLGLRVPRLAGSLAALAAVTVPVLQSSANLSGDPDARRLEEVPRAIRTGADLVLDGGELPGVPSTVVDLRRYEREGLWAVVREGHMPTEALARAIR
jgi:L-threonylcarbamoyladenylate synthase